MYCSRCGKEIQDNSKFCSYCGAPVGNNAAYSNNGQQASNNMQTGNPNYAYQTSSNGQAPKNNHRGLIVAGCIAAVIIVFIAVGLIVSSRNETTAEIDANENAEAIENQVQENENNNSDGSIGEDGNQYVGENENAETTNSTFFYYDSDGVKNEYIETLVREYSYNDDGIVESSYDSAYDYTLNNDFYITSETINTNGGGKSPQIFQYKYDTNGNLIELIHTYDGVTPDYTQEYEYDAKNQLVLETYTGYSDSGSPETPITTEYEYDANGNLILETKADGGYTTYSYTNGFLTEEIVYLMDGTPYSGTDYYYENGLLITEVHTPYNALLDPESTTIEYEYDNMGNLITETKSKQGEIQDCYKYEYDPNGNLIIKDYYTGNNYILKEQFEYVYQLAGEYFGN